MNAEFLRNYSKLYGVKPTIMKHIACINAIFALICMCFTANPAMCGSTRQVVGVLPFSGDSDQNESFGRAVAWLVSWQIYYIPGIDQVEMRRMVICEQMDRLARPASVSDISAYAQFARNLGVDWVITGVTERVGSNKLRFKVFVYPSDRSRVASKMNYEATPSSLPTVAARAATDIAARVGVGISKPIDFSAQQIDWRSLRAMENSLRARMSVDSDYYDTAKTERMADRFCRNKSTCLYMKILYAGYRSVAGKYIEDLCRFEKIEHGNLYLIHNIVDGYFDLNMPDKGREFLEYWKSVDPTSPGVLIFEEAASKNSSPAVTSARSLLKIDEHGWRAGLDAAEMYSDSRNIPEVGRLMKSVKSKAPNSAYVRVVSGQVWWRRGRMQIAVAELKKAAEINPDSYKIRIILAHALMSGMKYDEAGKVASSILARWPNKADAHRIATEMYFRNGMKKQGMRELEKLRELSPNDYNNRHALAMAYLQSGQLVEATRELPKADPTFRKYLMISSFVLTGVFLIAVVAIAIAVKILLAPERR